MHSTSSEETKTIVELNPEEVSLYDTEKKENLVLLRTIVSGKKDSGKSTLICGLLERDIDLRPVDQREKTKFFGDKTFYLSDWAFKLSLNELNPDISINNFSSLESYKIILLIVNDKELDVQLQQIEEDLQRLRFYKNHVFGSKIFLLLINNMREEGKLNLTERKNFDEKSWFWTTTEEKRKIYYFYNNYNTETSNVIEIRSNIIRLAEKKWKDVAMVKKIIIKQTNEESKKFDNNKCFTDISKSIMNTDISGKNGKKINKDFSCIIF